MNEKVVSYDEKLENDLAMTELPLMIPISAENNECVCCGRCCDDYLPITNEEIEVIDEYLKKNKLRAQKSKYEIHIDGKLAFAPGCPFRNNRTNKCKIYDIRPAICRKYQCDKSVEEIDFNNKDTLIRSMRLIFFNDDVNQKFMEDQYHVKLYGRNRVESSLESIFKDIEDLTKGIETNMEYILKNIDDLASKIKKAD